MDSVSNYANAVRFPKTTKTRAMTGVVVAIGLIGASIFAPPLGGAVILALATWKIGLISAALAGLAALVYAAISRQSVLLFKRETVQEKELPDTTAQETETVISGIVRDLERNLPSSIEINGKTTEIKNEKTLREIFRSLETGLGKEKATQVLSYFYQSAFARDTKAVILTTQEKKQEIVSYDPPKIRNNNNKIHVTVRGDICSVTTITDQEGELTPSLKKIHIYCHSTVANIFEKDMSVTRTIILKAVLKNSL
jgi:hypothetical protein